MKIQNLPKVNKYLKNFFIAYKNPISSEMILFFSILFGVTFTVIGFYILSLNRTTFNFEFDYTEYCGTQTICRLPIFEVTSNIPSPLFVQYKITNFLQNHYRYIKTKPLNQLLNGLADSDSNSNCSPYLTNFEMNKTVSVLGNKLNPNDVAMPCGLAAFTFFDDSFDIIHIESKKHVNVTFDDIAWKDDIDFKAHNIDLTKQWIDFKNQIFINWMRTSPFNSFIKTWGKINDSISIGQYQIIVHNNWFPKSSKTKKTIILRSTHFCGSANQFVIVFYIFVGILNFVFGFLLFLNWFKN